MRSGKRIGFAVLAAAAFGCAGAPSAEDQAAGPSALKADQAGTSSSTARAGGPRLMPLLTAPRPSADKAAAAKLLYWGGPVLANVKIIPVYWSTKVQHQKEMTAFYTGIVDSAYFDWLSEYNTPTQMIGRGTTGPAVVDPSAPASTMLKDEDIQAELGRMLDDGTLPDPDENTLFMVHFPPGVSISIQGATSCVQFCAYHFTFLHSPPAKHANAAAPKAIVYGVVPDMGGFCAFGCGFAPNPVDTLTTVSSHEMIEAVTDAQVGLATGNDPTAPMAWYDATNGEIGDICAGQQAKVAGMTVQLEWSNSHNACIATGSEQ